MDALPHWSLLNRTIKKIQLPLLWETPISDFHILRGRECGTATDLAFILHTHTQLHLRTNGQNTINISTSQRTKEGHSKTYYGEVTE